MGGHALGRGDAAYSATAKLGRGLAAAGFTVATGGGPGLMEAANLGALCPDDVAVDEAVAHLAAVPDFRPSITDWARRARDLDLPDNGLSLGIPTWFYGHEPPNLFCSASAKYFRNALREDTLLRSCNAGIVVMPGAAGTVQEIFQDACEAYYAVEGEAAPMVLVGREHWTERLPAWPLLERLLGDRPGLVQLADSPQEALGLLGDEG
jgi:predicted Rossmann-fold nucleotide-binding protein